MLNTFFYTETITRKVLLGLFLKVYAVALCHDVYSRSGFFLDSNLVCVAVLRSFRELKLLGCFPAALVILS